jgi:High potential iron-sulfur protein
VKPTRRTFIASIAATGAALIAPAALAQTKLDEKDPLAVALGYVHDSAKADGKKYPKHANTQICAGCVLWQSKATDPWGNCPLFAGRQVNAKGWCSSWVKKT